MYFAYTNPTYPFAKGQDFGEAVQAVQNATNQVGGHFQETASNATQGAAEAAEAAGAAGAAGAAEAAGAATAVHRPHHRPSLGGGSNDRDS